MTRRVARTFGVSDGSWRFYRELAARGRSRGRAGNAQGTNRSATLKRMDGRSVGQDSTGGASGTRRSGRAGGHIALASAAAASVQDAAFVWR